MPKPRSSRKDSIVEAMEKNKEQTFKVREKGMSVRIREKPSIDSRATGKYLGSKTIAEVDEVVEGNGSKSGWGHLVSGDGWVALDYVEILK